MGILRPFQMLPMPKPSEFDPGVEDPAFFYNNFVMPLVSDSVKMMCAGLHIDSEAVEELRGTILKVLKEVSETLARNSYIQQYMEHIRPVVQKAHADAATASVRKIEYFIKDFVSTNMIHRTYVVNNLEGVAYKEKWSVKDLKKLYQDTGNSYVKRIIAKEDLCNTPEGLKGMRMLAEEKLEVWNRPRVRKAAEEVVLKPFNPNSSKDVQGFFTFMGIEPIVRSKKTNDASWNRDSIEEVLGMTSDPILLEVLEAMIEFSFSGIIKSNFLKAFDSYTIDGVLHGTMKVFGAKSFRPTSKNPNLLNFPSTKSKYAKPLKKCLVASDGRVIYTADLSALEDRVIANLSGDVNKLAVFLDNLDGHSLAATYYFRKQIEILIGPFTDYRAASRLLSALVGAKNGDAIIIRQDGKPVSFGLAYGAYPPKIAAALKAALEEGERIFNVYHNELFPQITEYRENYVLPTAREQGYIHLGLGCRIYTDNASKDIRTLANGTVQFWSILTLIAVNELNFRIQEAGFQDRMVIQATIYDSIYVDVDADAELIAWLNVNMIECMTVQYLDDEIVHNEAQGEIGLNYADLFDVKNNASICDVQEILNKLK